MNVTAADGEKGAGPAEPVASVIVPCRNAADTVARALAGPQASPLRELEILAVDDGSTDGTAAVLVRLAEQDRRIRVLASGGRGVSAARNVALAAARGTFVFFVDADDEADPALFPRAIEAMRRDDADYCRVAHDAISRCTGVRHPQPLKDTYHFVSRDEIFEKFIPCFFGYSFRNVEEWYAGTPLFSRREMGTVWSGAFRLDVIRENGLRFDETVEINEDAMFLCEYLLACRRTTSVPDVLYRYLTSPAGALHTKGRGRAFFENKIRLLEKRKALDAKTGGRLASQYAASCVFSLLEILHAAVTRRGCRTHGLATFRRYGRDPVVRDALARFPLSRRKPFLACAVMVCRLFAPLLFGRPDGKDRKGSGNA